MAKRIVDVAPEAKAPRGPMRAMWKAELNVGGIQVPVKLYAAVEDRDVQFRLLDAKNGVPVKQRIVDPRSGKEVQSETILRGVEIDTGTYVVMSAAEIEGEDPPPSRMIELTRFVPRSAIDFAWFDRPYLLGPDGSESAFMAFAQALRKSERLGIARWTMRGKRYSGSLSAGDRHLSLVTLRSAEHVVTAAELPAPSGKPVSATERTLAKQLLSTLEGDFDPTLLRDEYREQLLDFLAAKAKGQRVRTKRETMIAPPDELTGALKRSIENARKRRAA
jgi:DNA end-binding protein Ku